MNILIIIVLIIIIVLGVFTSHGYSVEQFFNNENEEIDFYDFNPTAKKSICFIAGVHGNEPAGAVALNELIKNGYFAQKASENNIKIRVIPNVNKAGLKRNVRYQPNILYPDINRNFIENGSEPVSKKLLALTNGFDLVIDFHEGWGYYLLNNGSIGSTISPSDTELSKKLAEKMLASVNKDISDPIKRFSIRKNSSCDIPSTLACNMNKKQRNYILIETSGQNNIQPMKVRKQQIFQIIQNTF